MPNQSGQLLGSHIMLTEQNASEWKDAVVDKALIINAYHILIGMEMISSAGEDAAARANFRG